MPITDLAGNNAADFTGSPSALRTSYSLELCDYQTDTVLADLTTLATWTVSPRRSGQPLSIVVDLPAQLAELRTVWTDGFRYDAKGIRSLKARKDGRLIGHTLLWRPSYRGDENTTWATFNSYDPLILAKRRPFRDATGNLIDPLLASPISAAAIIQNGFLNSISNSGGAGDVEGALPLDVTAGIFDTTIPPASDMGIQLTNWPIMLDQVIALLAQTGACDIWVDPVDTLMGYPAGIIGVLNVANRRGTDISGTVHFDWGTGDHNARAITGADDMDEMVNKNQYYLGPKRSKTRWAGNITATEVSPIDLSAYAALQAASRTKYGYTTMRIRVFDDNDNDNAVRQMWHEVWKADVVASVDGQEVVKVTPTVDCAFEPFDDYNPGDTAAINRADTCGPALVGATQRIDGYDVAVAVDGVGEVSELQTLQDN